MDEKNILKIAYTLFVAVLIALFIGFGVNAFYPGPEMPEYPESSMGYAKEPSEEDQKKQAEYNTKYNEYNDELKVYNRTVSTITLASSVLLLVVSLVFEKRIKLIANGILLGGLFTLIYTLGLSFMVDNRMYSFIVVSISLAVVLVVGHLKFIRPENTSAKKKPKK